MIREEDYEQAVKDFINARLKTTHGRTPYEVRQKVMRAALSRGYEMNYLHDIDMEDVDWVVIALPIIHLILLYIYYRPYGLY